ncbi:MAG: hypothetical protein ACM3MH_05585 [Actinomycetota bacterium]
MLCKVATIVFLILLTTAGTVSAAKAADVLPISGPWGEVNGRGCDSYKEETEGPYFVVEEDGRGYGSGGECGCKIKSVEKRGEGAYSLVAICQCVDSPNKETEKSQLYVVSDSEIELDGTKYQKCEPLP